MFGVQGSGCLGVFCFRAWGWMKMVWDESVIGRNQFWMKVSLDEPVFGWKCSWTKVFWDEFFFFSNLDESVPNPFEASTLRTPPFGAPTLRGPHPSGPSRIVKPNPIVVCLMNKDSALSDHHSDQAENRPSRRLVLVSQLHDVERASDHEWDADTDSIPGASDVEVGDEVEPTAEEIPVVVEPRVRAVGGAFASLDVVNISEV